MNYSKTNFATTDKSNSQKKFATTEQLTNELLKNKFCDNLTIVKWTNHSKVR